MSLFEVLQLLSWLAVGLLLIILALTAGFDFGAGALLPFIAKSDEERRVVINTVGPTWDGNQVWLITAGGAIFAIWPRVYAASFSGFYIAFLLLLWSLFFRPVAFEYRSKSPSKAWKKTCDWALFVGSFIPALLIGVAVGNLFLGVPFQFDPVSLRFFYGTHMQDANGLMGLFGLLRPFALYCGVVSVVMMTMHGASYLALRTDGVICQRARTYVKVSAILLMILFAIGGVWINYLPGYIYTPTAANPMLQPLASNVVVKTGAWLNNFHAHPWMIIAPVLVFVGGLLTIRTIHSERRRFSFFGSCLMVWGVVANFGLSMYPFLIPSSFKPAQSLLLWNSSSSQISLIGILVVAVIMLPVIFVYTAFVYRKMWGRGSIKMTESRVQENQHTLY